MFLVESQMQKDREIVCLRENILHSGLIIGDWNVCLDSIKQLQRLEILDGDIRCLKARALCSLNRFDEAELVLNTLLSSNHLSSGLFHCLGLINLERRKLTDSIEFFSTAIELNEGTITEPNVSENITCRAKALALQGRATNAIEDLCIVKSLEPLEDAEDLYLSGKYLEAQNRIKLLPKDLMRSLYALAALARCLIAQGAYPEAIEVATNAIESATGSKRPYYYRALASLHAKQYSQCKDDISYLLKNREHLIIVDALSNNGRLQIFDNVNARMLRVQASCGLGDFVQAMRDLDYIFMRRPSWQAYLLRSHSALGLALYGTALGDAKAALAIEPGNADVQKQYSRCLLHLNDARDSVMVANSQPLQEILTTLS